MSRRGTAPFGVLLALAGSLALAPAASATTFCVPGFFAGCPNSGGNVAQANLETAATTSASDGIKDTIRIQPGHTYTDTESFVPTGTDDLDVIGGGASTVITSSSTSNIYAVRLEDRGGLVKLSDLTVRVPASFPDGAGKGAAMQMSSDVLENVSFISNNVGSGGLVSIIGTATLTDVSFPDTGSGSFDAAIRSDGNASGTIAVSGADIRGVSNGISNSGPSASYQISDSYIRSDATLGQTAISLSAGFAAIRNSVLVTPLGSPISIFANSSANASVSANGVTMYDTNPGATAPISVQTIATGNASATVSGSVARGFTAGYVRSASGGGSATLNINYSNSPQTGSSSGSGSVSVTNGIDADPLFANPAGDDFSLQPGSPSIDAANPASLLTTDFLGAPRPIDGDGDSIAVADQGAYEAPLADTTAPKTAIDSGPGKKAKKGKPRFTFSADEQASFECSLVKQGKPPKFFACGSPKLYELKRKRKTIKYTFSVRATDLADNVDASPATKSFRVKKKSQ